MNLIHLNLKQKLIVCFLLILIVTSIFAYIFLYITKKELKDSIGTNSILLVDRVIDSINLNINSQIELIQWQIKSNSNFNNILLASNQEFEKLENIEGYIQKKDLEWTSLPQDEISPFMNELINSSSSSQLRNIQNFYYQQYGYNAFSEIFITNKYGVNVIQTSKTNDYNQADEVWWQNAKRDGIFIEDIAYDESSKVYSINICIRIDDRGGNFLGVVKVVLNVGNIIELFRELERHNSKYTKTSFKLITKDGRIIYSTEDYQLLENISDKEYFIKINNKEDKEGYFLTKDKELQPSGKYELKEELFVYHILEDYKSVKGLNWIIILEYKSEEIFGIIDNFVNLILIILIIEVVLFSLIELFLYVSISRPLSELTHKTKELANGNFNVSINIKSKDEFGQLADSFNIMTLNLKKSKKKIEDYSEELEKQVNERTNELKLKVDELENTRTAILNILEDTDDANKKLLELQENLKANIKELKKLDEKKDQFISIAAHELKTPLTSIQGFSDLLSKSNVAENTDLRTKYLGIIHKDAKRLGELISNILDLSRIDIGALKIAYQDVKISDLIDEIKEQMDIIIKEKGLKSEFKFENNLPIINLDKGKVIQVISNLINNAIHYTEKGKIIVGVKKEDSNLLFSVSDTGMGIPKESQDRIFERFYQVDSPLTRKIGGTGLGLSICKSFIEAMNGKIWFESKIGGGTTFYFTLPIKKDDQKKEIELFNDKTDKGRE